jgi:phosphoglycolate phosphatase-like HAD superfamily hydrolase
MAKPLLLFDVDGTLIHTGGAGMRSFKRACEEIFGHALKLGKKNFAGKLDILIFKYLFETNAGPGLKWDSVWPLFQEKYLAYLSEEAKNVREWTVYPGVREFLDGHQKHCHFGLLTGNLKKGAQLKLIPVDLWDYFPCGAFGDTGDNREALAACALEAAENYYQSEFKEVWVIGDTVADIICGKSIGARTVGVRTGFAGEGELEASGADKVVDTLAEITNIE